MRPKPVAQGYTEVVLDALADYLDRVLDAYWEFAAATRWRETPDSPIVWEAEHLRKQYGPDGNDWDGQDGRLAFGMSVLYLAVVTQHLESIRLALIERLAIFGLQLPVRTSLELAGQVCWLLDPRLTKGLGGSPRDRAARWCLCRINDLTRAKTVAYSLNAPDATKYGHDLRDFRDSLKSRFYVSEWSPSADPQTKLPRDPHALRDERFPGGAERLRFSAEMANREDAKTQGVYDYLSNSVHPTLLAIAESMDPTGTHGFRLADASLPYRLVRMVAHEFLTAWRLAAMYIGVEDQAPTIALADELDSLPDPEKPPQPNL